MKSSHGFTLIELLIVITIAAIIGAISTPHFLDMTKNARHRESARVCASALRDARSLAITTNQRHMVVVNLKDRTLNLQRDDSGAWEHRKSFGPLVSNFKGGSDCGIATGTLEILFHPNGSSTSQFICISDVNGDRRFRVGISNPSTGRVVIQRWTGSGWK